MDKKLSTMERKLAEGIAKGLTQIEAWKESGYSTKCKESTMRANTSKILAREHVKKYLEELQREIQETAKESTIASAQEVQEFLTRVMRGEEKDEVVIKLQDKEFSKGGGMTVVERAEIIEVTPPMPSRNKAAELLGKKHVLWTDKREITQTNITVDMGEWEDDE